MGSAGTPGLLQPMPQLAMPSAINQTRPPALIFPDMTFPRNVRIALVVIGRELGEVPVYLKRAPKRAGVIKDSPCSRSDVPMLREHDKRSRGPRHLPGGPDPATGGSSLRRKRLAGLHE